jgi:hypothetical protein
MARFNQKVRRKVPGKEKIRAQKMTLEITKRIKELVDGKPLPKT